jgi:hypothetical protein
VIAAACAAKGCRSGGVVFAGDYPHGDVNEMGGGHVELPAAEMGNLEELSKVRE